MARERPFLRRIGLSNSLKKTPPSTNLGRTPKAFQAASLDDSLTMSIVFSVVAATALHPSPALDAFRSI
jgi:hypothetical protein